MEAEAVLFCASGSTASAFSYILKIKDRILRTIRCTLNPVFSKINLAAVLRFLLEFIGHCSKWHVLNRIFRDKFHLTNVRGRFLVFLFVEERLTE